MEHQVNGNGAGHVLAVHRALWRLADGAEVCATIKQLASASEVGEHGVRDSLRSLVVAGQIVPAGKRGKTSVFRLSPSTPWAETPSSRRDSSLRGSSSSSTDGRSTAHSDRGISPQSDEDREWFDNFEWTPELLDDYRRRALELFDRLGVQDELEDAGEGPCDDCGEPSRRRRYGRVAVCRRHAAQRFAARAKVAAMTVANRAEAA